MKKQRTFWLEDNDWRRLQDKIAEQGFEGKGKLERFMEKVCREHLFFIKGKGIVEISIK